MLGGTGSPACSAVMRQEICDQDDEGHHAKDVGPDGPEKFLRPAHETSYASADLAARLVLRFAPPAARRFAPPRFGAGPASRRAASSSCACSQVSCSGFIDFGIDAFVVPSVTYGPYRPARSFSVWPSLVSSRSVFFCAPCRRRDCFGARINASASSNEISNTCSSDSSERNSSPCFTYGPNRPKLVTIGSLSSGWTPTTRGNDRSFSASSSVTVVSVMPACSDARFGFSTTCPLTFFAGASGVSPSWTYQPNRPFIT